MSRDILPIICIDDFIININILIDKYGGPIAFSKKIGASYDSVLHWSKGRNLPDGKTLLKIHEKCGVSIDWLLTGTYSTGSKCPHCGDWPDYIRDLCVAVKRILESDDEVLSTALQSNIAALQQSIEKNKKLQARPKDKINPGKGVRDKPLESQAGPDPAAKSGVG